jgi:hypothetical protein
MSIDAPSELGWIPPACTLPIAGQPLRIAEFDALFATAQRAERISPTLLRVTLTGGPDLLDTTRDLTDRESSCCSFFTFILTRSGPATVMLDVQVPAAHEDVLDALAARSQAVR